MHAPELGEELEDSASAILEKGQEVGRHVYMVFPSGVRIEHGPENAEQAVRQTRELVLISRIFTDVSSL